MTLHAFGSNGSGQLGIGHKEDVDSPMVCTWQDYDKDVPQPDSSILSIAAGGNHTLVLFENGTVYSSGSNGTDVPDNHSESFKTTKFCRITNLTPSIAESRVRCISATWTASFFVSDRGVLSCGHGPKGELGLGSEIEYASDPVQIHSFPPRGTAVADIKSSMSHTVALISNGEVYGWGNGRKGQLGDDSGIVWKPRKLNIPFPAAAVACGRDFTAIAASPTDGRLLVLGSDRYGAVKGAPSSIRRWTSICASWCSIHVVIESALISWGRADRGQLLGSGIRDIQLMAAGSEHLLARLRDGTTLAWGWGEHGNCGSDHSEQATHTLITPALQSTFIAAGCATSFLTLSSED